MINGSCAFGVQLIITLCALMFVVQRVFALSKASGQKAAQYVLHKFPQNFANDPAEPQIEVCLPYTRAVYLWPPYGIGQAVIFLPCGFFFLFFSFFLRVISAVGYWMSTVLPHIVWP